MDAVMFGTVPAGWGRSGSGSGSGYGYGDGDGDGDYLRAILGALSKTWEHAQRSRLAALLKQKVRLAFWRSDKSGKPANGGSAAPVKPGDIQEESGPLELCSRGTLHATLQPRRWQGDRLWIVALHGEVVGDDEKLGCLKREIVGEVENWKP